MTQVVRSASGSAASRISLFRQVEVTSTETSFSPSRTNSEMSQRYGRHHSRAASRPLTFTVAHEWTSQRSRTIRSPALRSERVKV